MAKAIESDKGTYTPYANVVKVWEAVVDEGNLVYKTVIPARNHKEMWLWLEGAGIDKEDVIRIKDVTGDFAISVSNVAAALLKGGLSQNAVDVITRLVAQIPSSVD